MFLRQHNLGDFCRAQLGQRIFILPDVNRHFERRQLVFQKIQQLVLRKALPFLDMIDQRRNFAETLVIDAENTGFGNGRTGIDGRFDFLAADILAAADNNLFLAVNGIEIALFVEISDLTGAEETVIGKSIVARMLNLPLTGQFGRGPYA